MATTMHAVVVEAFGRPLALRERDIPVPGPGQILVKTEACGVCLTDFHAARGNRPSARLADGIALHFGCNLTRVCRHLSRMSMAARCTADRKFLASLS